MKMVYWCCTRVYKCSFFPVRLLSLAVMGISSNEVDIMDYFRQITGSLSTFLKPNLPTVHCRMRTCLMYYEYKWPHKGIQPMNNVLSILLLQVIESYLICELLPMLYYQKWLPTTHIKMGKIYYLAMGIIG